MSMRLLSIFLSFTILCQHLQNGVSLFLLFLPRLLFLSRFLCRCSFLGTIRSNRPIAPGFFKSIARFFNVKIQEQPFNEISSFPRLPIPFSHLKILCRDVSLTFMCDSHCDKIIFAFPLSTERKLYVITNRYYYYHRYEIITIILILDTARHL